MRFRSMFARGAMFLALGACSDQPTVPVDPGPLSVDLITQPPTTAMHCGESLVVTAKATNQNGHGAVGGVLFNFNVLTGGGSMFGGAAITDDKGLASDIWTLGFPDMPNTMAVRAVDASGTGTTYASMTITPLSRIALDNSAISVMNDDGSDVRPLPNTGAGFAFPAWSPDGTKIAMFRQEGSIGDILILNPYGAGGADLFEYDNLPPSDTVMFGRPAWSPDGSKIAFVMTTADPGTYIATVNADGSGGLTQLTFPGCGTSGCFPKKDVDPAWSPDGTKIAFGRSAAIWVMNADGSDQVALTDNTEVALQPAWSPDGAKIAFAGWMGNGSVSDEEIYVMNADGAVQKNLTANFPGPGSYPAWSPDGTRIAFTLAENDWKKTNPGEIAVVSADGLKASSTKVDGNHPAWTTGCSSK